MIEFMAGRQSTAVHASDPGLGPGLAGEGQVATHLAHKTGSNLTGPGVVWCGAAEAGGTGATELGRARAR